MPAESPLVARLQRRHVERLAALQPHRPVLAQVRDDHDQKATQWVRWNSVPTGRELWTRSVLLNEILFDVDTAWSGAAGVTADLVEALEEIRVPHYAHVTGGKGTHTSVFVDPDSIHADSGLLARAERLGVDPWSTARETLAEAFLDAAGYGSGEKWAPPIEDGVFDRLKVRWAAARSGSMVRVVGAPGSYGIRKTLVPEDWSGDSWRRAARRDTPPELRLRFPDEPDLWYVPRALNGRIVARLVERVERAESARVTQAASEDPDKALHKLVNDVPCVRRILTDAAPQGTRHYAFLNLVVTARGLGVTREAAADTLRRALDLCGLDERDKAWELLDEIYSGTYTLPKLTCPSPHVSNWCDKNRCCLSKTKVFG